MEAQLAIAINSSLKEDFRRLINYFKCKESWEFTDFLELWREQEFPLIFSVFTELEDMEFFTESILIISKNLFLETNQIFEKAGALYLMMAIYFSQPLVKRAQIRIEYDEFEKYLEFAEYVEDRTLNIIFAIAKLIKVHAFAYVVSTAIKSEQQNISAYAFTESKLRTNEVDDEIKIVFDIMNECEFNMPEWKESVQEYNKLIEPVSKLNMPSNSRKKFNRMESEDLLKEFVGEKLTKFVLRQRKKRGQMRLRRLNDIIRKGREVKEEVEEEEPRECSNSLPLIDNCDSPESYKDESKITSKSSDKSTSSDGISDDSVSEDSGDDLTIKELDDILRGRLELKQEEIEPEPSTSSH